MVELASCLSKSSSCLSKSSSCLSKSSSCLSRTVRSKSHTRHWGLFTLFLGLLLQVSSPAFSQRYATEQAFDRLEETLEPKVSEGKLNPKGIGPILLVGAIPAFEATRAWFPTAALSSLIRIFGANQVRACEACMNPTVHSTEQRLEFNTVLSLPDVARLDEELRGKSAPARSAIWLEETPAGLSIRIVSMSNGQVLFAGNFDGNLSERKRTAKTYNLSLNVGRKLRGESLTHIFMDFGLLPNQHISTDISEQFGPNNLNLAGLTLSTVDPIVGIGMHYYRVFPVLWNFTLGAKIIVSIPTALASALDQNGDLGIATGLIDPLVVGVAVARFPIPSTNFAVLATASSNFQFTLGVTLMNFSILPFLP